METGRHQPFTSSFHSWSGWALFALPEYFKTYVKAWVVCKIFFSHWDWQSPSKKCELARWSEVKFFDLKERASSLRLDRWQTLATSYCCFLLLFFSALKKKHSLYKNTHEQTPYMTCLERWKNNFTHLCDFHVQVNNKPVTCILYKQQCQINKNSKNIKETVAIIKIN